eukprot:m.27536 g.27536  ORF g.27536 m.27536 type:complete len:206 (+) comp8560_c0_seq1:187-804(+)
MSTENISPQVLKRLAKELKTLVTNPPEDIKVTFNEDDITDIQATIHGPEGTPYEGGVFRMKLVLSAEFPTVPPKGFFLTKIFHPNVSKTGDICVNTLKRDWKPDLGISHVLTVVRCLLIHPNPESALNEEAGKLLLEQYDDYAKHARMMTEIHARPTASEKENGAGTSGGAIGDAPIKKKVSSATVDKKLKRPADKNKKRSLKRL